MSKNALAVDISDKNLPTPEIIEGNKSLTLNGMGYVFFTISPLSQLFLDEVKDQRVLEIGAGYNDIPMQALKNGVSEYIANDLSPEHLEILYKKAAANIQANELSRLKLVAGKAPQILKELEGKFDAIIANLVMHFFTPQEIKEFIESCKAMLKTGGKIYISVASPCSRVFAGVNEAYQQRKAKGEEFPGYFTDLMSRVNKSDSVKKDYPQFKIPEAMVLFSREDLVNLFEKQGLKVTNSYSLQIPTASQPSWLLSSDDESTSVGIISVKE